MKRYQKTGRTFWVAILMAVIFFLVGCGKNFESMSAKEIYEFGSQKFEKKKYSEAIDAYNALIDLYPFSIFVSKAELGVADSQFKKRRWDEAIPSYEDFLERHPTNEQVPHVIYHLGMCYYKKKMAIDRDQTATFESENNFHKLITDYPESQYYAEAREKITLVRADLAKRERYVAKFYFREKEYYASLRRFLRVIRNYPDTKYFQEALYYSARCYLALGEDESAKQQLTLLKSKFPDGRYGRKAEKLLAKTSQ